MERIRQLITLKPRSKIYPTIVKLKGKDITNPADIANAFNNFFVEIAPNLSKTIPDSTKPFRNFLKNSSFNSFLLRPTTGGEVHKLISQSNIRKALGLLSIPVTIFKVNVNVSSKSLSLNVV